MYLYPSKEREVFIIVRGLKRALKVGLDEGKTRAEGLLSAHENKSACASIFATRLPVARPAECLTRHAKGFLTFFGLFLRGLVWVDFLAFVGLDRASLWALFGF